MSIPSPSISDVSERERVQRGGEAASIVSCCSWTGRTWRKIVVGSTVATNLGSLAVLIYGLAVNNPSLTLIGAGSGAAFSAVCLLAHAATYQCEEGRWDVIHSQARQVDHSV